MLEFMPGISGSAGQFIGAADRCKLGDEKGSMHAPAAKNIVWLSYGPS